MLSISSFLDPKFSKSLNCQEAYSTWDLLAAKYQFKEKLHFWRNFTHDEDLMFIK